MAYKVFTNGSTLQASEVNDNLMKQAVATFTNAAARTAAITSPVEGQLTYLEDADRYFMWNGSAWVSPFGLTLIKSQTIGTAVTSVTITNAFSSEFDNYLVKISGGVGSAQVPFYLTIGNATSGYNYTSIYTRYDTGTIEALRELSQARFQYVGGISANNLQMECNIDLPFLAKQTLISAQHNTASSNGLTMTTKGYLANTNSYTDFTVAPASGNITGGTIKVYGYRN